MFLCNLACHAILNRSILPPRLQAGRLTSRALPLSVSSGVGTAIANAVAIIRVGVPSDWIALLQ